MGINGQRKITSARGETVDFDLLMIKQQLAEAPQNIEVARRQEFIDSKEAGKSVRKKAPVVEANQPIPAAATASSEFENPNGDEPLVDKKVVEPVPVVERPAAKK